MEINEFINMLNKILDEEIKYRNLNVQVSLKLDEYFAREAPGWECGYKHGRRWHYMAKLLLNDKSIEVFRYRTEPKFHKSIKEFKDWCRRKLVEMILYKIYYKKETGLETLLHNAGLNNGTQNVKECNL